MHARGAGAHGYFEAYGRVGDKPIVKYTRAKLFQEAGKRTPVFVRFSTVVGNAGSPETMRDPRGFAVKFYTDDGNWDLVGNNLKVFFIRDPLKFPDMVHAFRADPVSNLPNPERMFDFCSQSPESTHMVTLVMSPWGIPANYRQMQGSGVNTYKWVNQDGEAVLVKYHWELCVQMMRDDEHPELDFDPLDPTKLWDKERFPFLPICHEQIQNQMIANFTEADPDYGRRVADGLAKAKKMIRHTSSAAMLTRRSINQNSWGIKRTGINPLYLLRTLSSQS